MGAHNQSKFSTYMPIWRALLDKFIKNIDDNFEIRFIFVMRSC